MKHIDFNKLYEEHAGQIYKFLLRLCKDADMAEDLLQDTFLKAIEKVDAFDNRCKFTTWLCEIAKNTYYDSLRKKQAQTTVYMLEENLVNQAPLMEDALVHKETAREIHEIIHQLPEPYKEVFLLRFYGELPFREIGQIFGKSEVWGRVTYLRGKDMVIQRMEK